MHSDEMSKNVERFFVECDRLQWKKNADYHPDKIAYLEILQTAFETRVRVEQDLWGRIRKQMSALRRFVIEGHVESESPESRMIDVAVYMGMMAVWTEFKVNIVQEAYVWVVSNRRCEAVLEGQPDCVDTGTKIPCERCEFVRWLYDYSQMLQLQAGARKN